MFKTIIELNQVFDMTFDTDCSKGNATLFIFAKGGAMEQWRDIPGFPDYEISSEGRVCNIKTDFIVQRSYTQQGGAKVGLHLNGEQLTRSVKVLVAQAFVPGENMEFNTPILLDGNQENCSVENIMWRPRWFAWHYTRQFSKLLPVYEMGPIVELNDRDTIIEVYEHVFDAGISNGLLLYDVWTSLHTFSHRQPIFPTKQVFAFPSKVQ
jgi:hypothetical protein